MALIDLRAIPQNECVLHFGGRPNEIDAFTFSNALIGFAEAIREINHQIRPEMSVEITIDGVGPGSFRAKIKTKLVSLGGLFKPDKISGALLLGILAALIYDRGFPHDPERIIVDGDMVVIQQGHDRIIIPKEAWEAKQRLGDKAKVERHVSRAFSALDSDPSVTDFGIFGGLNDEHPFLLVPKDDFDRLVRTDDTETDNRFSDEETRLSIVKAVFQRGGRKWEFVWNGLRISAVITDAAFFDRLASRELWFAQGDELEVTLRIHKKFDDLSRVYVNERYEIISVKRVIHRDRQDSLPINN